MKTLTAHKESFDNKKVHVTKEAMVTKKEWIDSEGELPVNAKIIDERKVRFGRTQLLCVWKTKEPTEWRVSY